VVTKREDCDGWWKDWEFDEEVQRDVRILLGSRFDEVRFNDALKRWQQGLPGWCFVNEVLDALGSGTGKLNISV
jgi:hypothetical protein